MVLATSRSSGLMAGASRRRCRRGSIRRRGYGRASGGRSGTSPCCRRRVVALLVAQEDPAQPSEISLLTSKRFIIFPDPWAFDLEVVTVVEVEVQQPG